MNNKYIVLDSINEGHKIYLAKNIQNNQICVKKIMDTYNLEVYKYLKAFRPFGIPKIYDIESYANSLVVYEEYIKGDDLEKQIENGLVLDKTAIINICLKLCEILDDLNSSYLQIVHRDIKPSNIIYLNNNVYLIDFNAAKFVERNKSRDTVLMGTEGYAAPEQYGFGSSCIQSDIFSIGILLKELTDHYKIKDKAIDYIISKCTMIDPKRRYLTFKSLIFDLANPSKYGSRRYYPVGFRSLKKENMILATFGYLFIIFMFSGVVASNGSLLETYMDRIFFIVLGIVLITYFGNYLDWWQKWGYKNNWNEFIKLLWVSVVGVMLTFISMFMFFLFEGIIIQFIR